MHFAYNFHSIACIRFRHSNYDQNELIFLSNNCWLLHVYTTSKILSFFLMQPAILPLQILRVGQLVILVVPGGMNYFFCFFYLHSIFTLALKGMF